jgi:hypothetical protein
MGKTVCVSVGKNQFVSMVEQALVEAYMAVYSGIVLQSILLYRAILAQCM